MADEYKFEHESLQDSNSIQDFLQSLVEGFEKGRISLSTEDKEIHLNPGTIVKFKVKARKKPESDNYLQIKITWKETKQSQDDSTQTIRIIS